MLRGLLLAGFALVCAGPAHADARADLMARAEAELKRGENAAALDDFERAAMMRHEADAEIGLIRAAMQDGQYRRSLAFAAHTVGEHLESAQARVLYARLLRLGGQQAMAQRVLPDASGAEAGAAWLAPWPSGAVVPEDVRFVSSALLLGDGSMALAPAPEANEVWVRNGLGQARPARVDRSDASLQAAGLVLLHLEEPLPTGGPPAAREPFAGSPGFVLSFTPDSRAAWPQLSQGFLGAQAGTTLRQLGFDIDQLPALGAPVLDRQGRAAGIVVDAQGRWLPLARAIRDTAVAPDTPSTGLTAPDQVYEAGLRLALQVLAPAK